MPIYDEQMKALGHGIVHANGLSFGGSLDEVFYVNLFGLATKILEWIFPKVVVLLDGFPDMGKPKAACAS